MKIKAFIISLVSVVICAVAGILLYIYWPAITGTIKNNQYLTPEQGQEMYNKGYEDGNKAEEEQLAQIAYYRQLTDDYYVQVGLLNNEISQLNGSIASKNETIIELTNIKNSNLQTISDLNATVTSNQILIANLNSQISNLNDEITILENTVTNNEIELINKQNSITSLTNQVNSLMTLKTQLEQTNQSNLNTISILNAQIVGLNNQVSSLNLQIQNNSNNVTSLNNRITELENSISYYESYIASLQSASQVVATFLFDGSVYNIQVLNTNSYASVTAPTSTAYKIFNGWTVNGQSVNLANYAVSANTTFVADVTYKYDVTFKVDNITYDSQIVIANGYATLPTAPTKSGYQFDGWTLDGQTVVDLSNNAITSNTIYVAKFTQLFNVTFIYENSTLSTQTIRNGSYATAPTVNNTTYKIFNGWKVNETSVNVATYAITANITFVADITYKYDVTFKVDNTTYDTQIIISGSYATIPTAPTKNGYVFDGWTIDGTNIVNVSTNVISANTIYVAKFTQVFTVTFTVDNATYDTQTVRSGDCASIPTAPTKSGYVFDGWTINGTDLVNIANTLITSTTTYTAKFTASVGWHTISSYNHLIESYSSNETKIYTISGIKAGCKTRLTGYGDWDGTSFCVTLNTDGTKTLVVIDDGVSQYAYQPTENDKITFVVSGGTYHGIYVTKIEQWY